MTKRHLDIAKQLLRLPTAPFCEHAVIAWVKAFLARRPALRWREDRWGNLLIHYGRPARGRGLVFAAHMDHPGFCALKMVSERQLSARWLGFVPERLFAGAKVRFFSGRSWVKGVVSSIQADPQAQVHKVVLIAVTSPVQPGAVGMWDFPDPKVVGTRLVARGCDDVAGVASLMALLDEACRRKTSRSFSVFLTRAEEGGFLGAIGACRTKTLPPNSVIVAVETSKELPTALQGDGPIVRVGDRSGIFTPAVTSFLAEVAKRLAARPRQGKAGQKGFRWQRKLMDAGTCESSVYVEYGYAAGGLCLPLGNYHNVRPSGQFDCAHGRPEQRRMGGKGLAAEYIDLRDFEGLVSLYLAVVDDFPRYGKSGPAFRLACERRFRRLRRLF